MATSAPVNAELSGVDSNSDKEVSLDLPVFVSVDPSIFTEYNFLNLIGYSGASPEDLYAYKEGCVRTLVMRDLDLLLVTRATMDGQWTVDPAAIADIRSKGVEVSEATFTSNLSLSGNTQEWSYHVSGTEKEYYGTVVVEFSYARDNSWLGCRARYEREVPALTLGYYESMAPRPEYQSVLSE